MHLKHGVYPGAWCWARACAFWHPERQPPSSAFRIPCFGGSSGPLRLTRRPPPRAMTRAAVVRAPEARTSIAPPRSSRSMRSSRNAPGTLPTCTIGGTAQIDIDLHLDGTNTDRQDVGLFVGQSGNDPGDCRWREHLCSVATTPTADLVRAPAKTMTATPAATSTVAARASPKSPASRWPATSAPTPRTRYLRQASVPLHR